jgi:hypothetical protein
MVLLISLLLVARGAVATSGSRWASPDALIEDSLGAYVDFAADYNYSNGDLYIACIPDSGTYFGTNWGLLVFRSTDHGDSGGVIFADAYSASSTVGKEIDLVATRSDTLYALVGWHFKAGYDGMQIAKIYDAGGSWTSEWIGPYISATEIRSPKLERDDFDDFYLYMEYLNVSDAGMDYVYVLRSTNRGYDWDTIAQGNADEYQDLDITTADSSLYCLSTYQHSGYQHMEFCYLRNRGDISTFGGQVLFINDTLTNKKMYYPRIGATTTLPDTGQLVYAFFSQENSVSGDYDLLYKYSENGGSGSFTATPDTLVKGSSSPILCDLRGYQVEPNEYMDLVFSFSSSVPSFENTWLWSMEGNPTNWQGATSVATGANRSMPELVYSPGATVGGGAVVYNDSLGNLWFDAPWRESGIVEETGKNEDKIRSQIALSGSLVKLNSSGAVVYDVTGREIRKLNTAYWDSEDGNGKGVESGIYFIVNEKTGERVKLSILK